MNNPVRGRAHVLGKNIDTDQIYPGRYLELVAPSDIAAHCLEGVDPAFPERIETGDILVAGTNFGCGSSREHAAIAIKSAGVALVLAESFARIFYRNAVNLALPVLICPGIGKAVENGDVLKVDLKKGLVFNETRGIPLEAEKLSPHIARILESGGIKPLFRERTAKEKDGK